MDWRSNLALPRRISKSRSGPDWPCRASVSVSGGGRPVSGIRCLRDRLGGLVRRRAQRVGAGAKLGQRCFHQPPVPLQPVTPAGFVIRAGAASRGWHMDRRSHQQPATRKGFRDHHPVPPAGAPAGIRRLAQRQDRPAAQLRQRHRAARRDARRPAWPVGCDRHRTAFVKRAQHAAQA